MGKKGSWFGAVKRAFSPNSKQKHDPKPVKEKRKWGFGKLKHPEAARLPAVLPSPPPNVPSVPIEEKTLFEAEQEQNRHACAVAAATEAAAEAVVAAPQAAAEVVRLVGTSYYTGKSAEECAAIKIQTAFRGYLARRALRALRGLARLQALVQGQSVKRQATTTLRCMQGLVRVQSQIRARRIRMSEENQALQRQLQQTHIKELENTKASLEDKYQEEWDDSLQSKEEIEANILSKQEAAIKRERALAYAYSHQLWKNSPKSSHPMLMELDPDNPHWGWSWLERWMAARPWESRNTIENEIPERCSSVRNLDLSIGEIRRQRLNINICGAQGQAGAETPTGPGQKSAKTAGPKSPFTPVSKSPVSNKLHPTSPYSVCTVDEDARSMYSLRSEKPRYSSRHSLAGSSVRDDDSLASFPAFPSYMASTQSAKAKVRSHSPQKQRLETPDRDSFASAKKRLSFPLTDEKTSKISVSPVSLKGHSGPSKSDRFINSLKDLSNDSDRSLVNENGRKPYR